MRAGFYILLFCVVASAQDGRRPDCGMRALSPDHVARLKAELADVVLDATTVSDPTLKSLLTQNIERLRREIEKATNKPFDAKEIQRLVEQRQGRQQGEENKSRDLEKQTRTREEEIRLGWTYEPQWLGKGLLPEHTKNFRVFPDANGEPVVLYDDYVGSAKQGKWKAHLLVGKNKVRLDAEGEPALVEAMFDGKGRLQVLGLSDALFDKQVLSFVDPDGGAAKKFSLKKLLPALDEESFFNARPLIYRDAGGATKAVLAGDSVDGGSSYYQVDPVSGKAKLLAKVDSEHALSRSADGSHLHTYGFEGDQLVVRDIVHSGKIVLSVPTTGKRKLEEVQVARGRDGRVYVASTDDQGKALVAAQGLPTIQTAVRGRDAEGSLVAGPGNEMYFVQPVAKGTISFYGAGSAQRREVALPGWQTTFFQWVIPTDRGPLVVINGSTEKSSNVLYTVLLPEGAVQGPIVAPAYGAELVDAKVAPNGKVLALFQDQQAEDRRVHLVQLYGRPK